MWLTNSSVSGLQDNTRGSYEEAVSNLVRNFERILYEFLEEMARLISL